MTSQYNCRMLASVKTILFPAILIFLFTLPCFSQIINNDSAITAKAKPIVLPSEVKQHSPLKAMLLSAAFPGLGQIYNRKYWKLPLVYAAMGTTVYYAIAYNNEFQKFHNAYIISANKDSSNFGELNKIYTVSQLQTADDFYRYYRDLFIILSAGAYVLNLIDAYVDGHLFYFNISDDLGMHISPEFRPISNQITAFSGISSGFTLRFDLKAKPTRKINLNL